MENYEDLLHKFEEFERMKLKELPKELEDFIGMVAKNGDPIYPWTKVRHVYRAKIISVLTQFYESSPTSETSHFSFDSMKAKILERFDTFRNAPFTIQRLSELLISPRKEYNRIDKFIRAIEKNILVVSVAEPGCSKHVHLNGSVDSMEEGFQVSSTSAYEDYRQRVAGLMEHEVAAASISEDRQNEIHKNGRCKRGDEDMREDGVGEVGKKGDEGSPVHIGGCDGDTSTQARLSANQGLLDHQEFHRLEFSLAESDTLAIVEIVSEVDCPAEISEDTGKDYPLSHPMMDNSPGVHETVVGPAMPDVDNCDTVTEVVATDTSGSVSLEEDLASSEKVSLLDKDTEDTESSVDSPPKGVSSPTNISGSNTKLDCQKINMMDVGGSGDGGSGDGGSGDGGSGDTGLKGKSDSVGLSDSTKVVVITSSGESELPETVNENPLCNEEAPDTSKEELSYLDKNDESANEKPCNGVEGNEEPVNVEHHPEAVPSEESPEGSCEAEGDEEAISEQTMVADEVEPESYKGEAISPEKKDDDDS